ncbi:MAG: DNA-directed RNA polymerase subunit H [Candidatus Diapherotrites archaeon]|nr:DNA-directed RNA polymerase subunit H [Candidatus Diapherotrites archaeon]
MEEQKISEHFLVPKHEIIPKELEHVVLEKLGTKKEHISKIPRNDPVIEEINAEPGDIIKITRESKTAGKAIYFRVVA